MKTISRYIMTLALLLTAVTGAWATDPNTVEWKGNEATWKGWTDSETTHTVGDITITCSGNAKAYEHTFYSGRPLVMVAGNNDAITFTSNGAPFTSIKIRMYGDTDPGLAGWTWDNGHNIEWSGTPSTSVTLSGCDFAADMITFTFAAAEPPITVEPGSSANTWTFSMPGSDVVLTPQYAPAAKWDVVENVEQLPAALEGIIAGQDAAIVTAGQSAQGTVMYAVTTSAEAAPALTAFSATVPTAKDVADDGATLYVWYYIKGQDTPDGQQATEENTFNDTEICTTPLTVQVLTNKYDITLKAANANTIEAGKATVTVGGTAATVTDGKLQGVKMGSEVKMTAKEGYKFRKVEVKKGGAAVMTTVTWNSSNVFNSAHEYVALDKWSPAPLTYEGVTISFSGTKVSSFQAYDEVEHIGSLICYGNNGDSFTFTAPSGKKFCKIEIINNGFMVFTNYGDWTSDTSNKIVWSGTAANAVTLGSVFTDADNLNSIVFYLSE